MNRAWRYDVPAPSWCATGSSRSSVTARIADAPSRLVYSFRLEEPDPGDRTTTVTLSLRDLAEATELSLTQGEFVRLELHRNGWTDSFAKLGRFVRSGP